MFLRYGLNIKNEFKIFLNDNHNHMILYFNKQKYFYFQISIICNFQLLILNFYWFISLNLRYMVEYFTNLLKKIQGKIPNGASDEKYVYY